MKQEPKVNASDGQKEIETKFSSLPFAEKLSTLFKMEIATVSEAVDYVIKDPMRVLDRIAAVMTDIGGRIGHEVHNAASSARNERATYKREPDAKKRPRRGGTSESRSPAE